MRKHESHYSKVCKFMNYLKSETKVRCNNYQLQIGLCSLLAITLTAITVHAGNSIDLQPDIKLSRASGQLILDSNVAAMLHYATPAWKNFRPNPKNFHNTGKLPDKVGKYITLNAKWNVGSDLFNVEEKFIPKADGSVDSSWRLKSETGIKAALLVVEIKLPASYEGRKIIFGKSEIILPVLTEKTRNLMSGHIDKIIIQGKTRKIIITGKLNGAIVAARIAPEKRLKYGYYAIRLRFSEFKGIIKNSNVNMNIAVEKYSSEPIDISKVANTSLMDDVNGDRKGGWTDQGADKDLRSLNPGKKVLGGINFNILDASKNAGKNCIVLKGEARNYLPETTTIPMNGQKYRQLYLLHATAWGGGPRQLVGDIKVNYCDKSSQTVKVYSTVDVGGWAKSESLPNAVPVWTGSCKSFLRINLYRSSFLLPDKELQSISFTSGNKPVWMVVAVSGTKDLLDPPVANFRTITYKAGKKWPAVEWQPSIIKNSALDFYNHANSPAGKYGDVICKGNNFYFRNKPHDPVRFYGGTMTHALPYLDKKQAEHFADYLASSGFNAIRFHCYIRGMSKNDGSPELDPVGLNKFCYLLYCLRQRGIYYTFPLNGNTGWGKVIINDPAIPEFTGRIHLTILQSLVPLSDSAMQWMKDFSRNLLLHVNPYTGEAIKDDPALLGIELMNEDNLFVRVRDVKVKSLYERKCKEFLSLKTGRKPTKKEVKQFMPEFVVQMQQRIIKELKSYLGGIGVHKPITDISSGNSLPLALSRQYLDYVDGHAYWDLGSGKDHAVLHNVNPNQGMWKTQLYAGSSRLFGSPFVMGEYNMVYPVPYAAYMRPANAAIAGLQNWSGIFSYGLQTSPGKGSDIIPQPSSGVHSFNPMIMLTERIGSMIFRHGGVKKSDIIIPYVVTKEYIMAKLGIDGAPRVPDKYYSLGLVCQIGTVIYDSNTDFKQFTCVVVPPDMKVPVGVKGCKIFKADNKLYNNLKAVLPEMGNNIYKLPNGQTSLDISKKTFTIVSQKFECFLIPESIKKIQGNNITISGNKTVSTCFVSSIDRLPLKASKRMLALYITDLKNSGSVIEYHNKGQSILRKVGKTPFLLKQGKIAISIRTENPGLPKIWALKYDGSRKVAVKPKKTKDGFSFTAKAVTEKDTYFAYEIAWK